MTISEKLPSRLEIIPKFIFSLTEKLRELSLDEEDIFNISLSLEEALVNAAKHGNKSRPELLIEVNIEADNERLTIKVRDQGKGFDVKSIPDPTLSTNIMKLSGRGLFLIHKLMDKVEFFDGGRGIIMVKFLKNPGGRLRQGG